MDTVDQQHDADASATSSVLRQMTRASSDARQSQTMSLAKALRITVAKVAQDQMDMAMAVIGARVETRGGNELSDLFEGGGLLMLLDGPHHRRGAAVFDADCVGGLIQQQTMGRVTAPSGGDPRPMTPTDAAISAPFLDSLLSRASALPDDPIERSLMDGFAFGARVEDVRLLLMGLEDTKYHIVHLTVDIAGGVRQGRIMLCLPAVPTGHGPDGLPIPLDEEDAKPEPAKLDQNVLALNVELNIALTALKMPLSAVQALAVGDVFELGITAFDQASVQTKGGRRLGGGVLGQVNGIRAMQLEHTKSQNAEPRRRASDRDGLDLLKVRGDGTGTQGNSRIGDTSDDVIADLHQEDALPKIQNLPALPKLGDLPDMSDLTGFEDDHMLPQMEAG